MFSISFLTLVIALATPIFAADEPDCTKTPQADVKTCCKYADLITPSITQKCESFKQNDDSNEDKKPHFNKCYMECVLNETGIMQNLDEAKIDAAKLKSFLAETLKDDAEIISIMEEAYITCAAEGQAMKEKLKNSPPPPLKENECKPIAAGIMGCAFVKTLMSCPGTKWTNSEDCNNFKNYVTVCGKHHHPKA